MTSAAAPRRRSSNRSEGRRIAYTIVDGDALDWPGNAEPMPRDGVDLRTFQDGDRTVVTWRRHGKTCILSSTSVPRGRDCSRLPPGRARAPSPSRRT
jgi:hypothetical protein